MHALSQGQDANSSNSPSSDKLQSSDQGVRDLVEQQSDRAVQASLPQQADRSLAEPVYPPSDMHQHQSPGFLSQHHQIDLNHLSPYAHLSDHLSETAYDSFSDYTTPGFGDDLSDIALSSMLGLDENSHELTVAEPSRTDRRSESTSKGGTSSVGDSVTHPSTRLLSPVMTNPSLSRASTADDITVEPSGVLVNTSSHPYSDAPKDATVRPAGDLASAGARQIFQTDRQLLRKGPGLLGVTTSAPKSTPDVSDLSGGKSHLATANATKSKQMSPAPTNPSSPGGEEPETEPSRARRGISPVARSLINETTIPTLEEQQRERELATTKAGVEKWLTTASTSDMEGPSAAHEINSQSKDGTNENTMNETKSPPGQTTSNPPTPGPGVYVNQDDEDESADEYDTDEFTGSQVDSDNDATPPAPYNPNRAVPTPSDTSAAHMAPWSRRPWADSPYDPDSASLRGQPLSSNAAIARFARRAKDTETASVTATIASSFRRRSLESMFSAANISIVPPSEPDSASISAKNRIPSDQRPSLLGRILPKRSNSNIRKRRDTRESEQRTSDERGRKDTPPNRPSIARVPSWARAKSPSLSSIPTPLSQQPRSATTLAPSSSPWTSVTNVIKRARSRSDIGTTSALAEQWASSGGPPVANLRPPSPEDEPEVGIDRHDSFETRDEEAGADADGEHTPIAPVDMQMGPMEAPSAPTPESFKAHTLKANPHIELYMLERVTSEQLKRYRKLVEARLKHTTQIDRGNCPAGDHCSVLGNGPRMLEPRKVSADAESPAVSFYINRSGSSSEAAALGDEESTPANFPEGIPLPPAGVQRLPAEFECPLCFQVKRFLKPSDWTKHVHEDLQPFTCSFPDCGEPKSFKRKADWVRHENERHRQLEKWICNYPDCQHVCYRKDNFVQHLVREHKLPEPKLRPPKSSVFSGLSDQSQVGKLIEICRYETPRRPEDEPCRFCGNYLKSWKKLSAHLAKHMEYLSLPILSLARQVELSQSTAMSPADQVIGRSRQGSAGDISNPLTGEGTPLDASYGGSATSESRQTLQVQQYGRTPTPGSTPGFHGETNFTPMNAYTPARLTTQSYPGTKHLQRQPSPFADQPLVQPAQYVDDQSYTEHSPSQTYASVFDNSANILPGAHGLGVSLTYPPSFVPATNQSQLPANFVQSPMYNAGQLYHATFGPAEFSNPSNPIHHQGYQYTHATDQAPAMHFTRGAISQYPPRVPSGTPMPQYAQLSAAQYAPESQPTSHQYPQAASTPYSAGTSPFPQIQLEGQSAQQEYLSSSSAPGEQGYYLSRPPFEGQEDRRGQGRRQFAQQDQQHYEGYYGS